jgi:2-methylisocitrate lyase-like PEP mutase family enzyme
MRTLCGHFAKRVPLLANMVEGGRTPFLPAAELGKLGYRIVIFPGGTVRALIQSMNSYFTSLREHGTTTPYADRMLDFKRLQKVLGTEATLERGRRYEADR